jgi:hypothetical protein
LIELLVKPQANGKALTGKAAEVDGLKWNKTKKAYVLRLQLDPDRPVIRRLTLLARSSRLEARKTIELPAAD